MKNIVIISLEYTHITQLTLFIIFLMYVATIQCFNYRGQFAVYISNTPVTLKQSQGPQTKNDNIDPKQGYTHAKFERSCFNGVQEKSNVKGFFFFPNEEVCQSSPLNMYGTKKYWSIHNLLDVISKCKKGFNLII